MNTTFFMILMIDHSHKFRHNHSSKVPVSVDGGSVSIHFDLDYAINEWRHRAMARLSHCLNTEGWAPGSAVRTDITDYDLYIGLRHRGVMTWIVRSGLGQEMTTEYPIAARDGDVMYKKPSPPPPRDMKPGESSSEIVSAEKTSPELLSRAFEIYKILLSDFSPNVNRSSLIPQAIQLAREFESLGNFVKEIRK